MKLEFLGTGGYFANGRRQTACLLLPEWGIVFDAGSGIYRLPARLQTREIQLFLTHAHLDHIGGLPCLLMPVLSHQLDSIRVHGTESTIDAVTAHLFEQRIFPVPPPFETAVIASTGELEVRPGVTLRWQALPSHPGGSMAYRIDADLPGFRCAFAYITDTTMDGTYEDFILDVDLLVHECYFDDARAHLAERTGHCHSSQVAELACRVNAGRLIVLHVDPTIDLDDPVGLPGMRSIFPRTELGFDGMITEVVPS